MSDDRKDEITEELKEAVKREEDATEMGKDNKTAFSDSALDKMIHDLKDDTADVVPEDFDFGEKKVDKKKRGKFIIKLISAIICLGVFLINGIMIRLMTYRVYAKVVPVWVGIIIIIACLYAVAIIANIIGGDKQEEYHVKEEE